MGYGDEEGERLEMLAQFNHCDLKKSFDLSASWLMNMQSALPPPSSLEVSVLQGIPITGS